jgi:hypothetical protein
VIVFAVLQGICQKDTVKNSSKGWIQTQGFLKAPEICITKYE